MNVALFIDRAGLEPQRAGLEPHGAGLEPQWAGLEPDQAVVVAAPLGTHRDTHSQFFRILF